MVAGGTYCFDFLLGLLDFILLVRNGVACKCSLCTCDFSTLDAGDIACNIESF